MAEMATRSRTYPGQFMTPAETASMMASSFGEFGDAVRLLEPAAGRGALVEAFAREVAARDVRPRSLDCVCIEVDPSLASDLHDAIARARTVLETCGVEFTTTVVTGDFFTSAIEGAFTHVLTNPPYGKVRRSDPIAGTLVDRGIRAANLYTAFAIESLRRLADGGELVALTPRSFCNGRYHRPFRRELLGEARLRSAVVFDRRDRLFAADDVLQETVIWHVERGAAEGDVRVSIDGKQPDDLPYPHVVRPGCREQFIRLEGDVRATSGAVLADLGVSVSTGRAVEFQVRDHLSDGSHPDDVAFVHPSNVVEGEVRAFPADERKATALRIVAATERLALPAGAYVVVKRTSSREERRRLTAAVWDGPSVVFENHLNVLHADGGGLDPKLAEEIAEWLNSAETDAIFRSFSGSTQVNATDLRQLPIVGSPELRLRLYGRMPERLAA